MSAQSSTLSSGLSADSASSACRATEATDVTCGGSHLEPETHRCSCSGGEHAGVGGGGRAGDADEAYYYSHRGEAAGELEDEFGDDESYSYYSFSDDLGEPARTSSARRSGGSLTAVARPGAETLAADASYALRLGGADSARGSATERSNRVTAGSARVGATPCEPAADGPDVSPVGAAAAPAPAPAPAPTAALTAITALDALAADAPAAARLGAQISSRRASEASPSAARPALSDGRAGAAGAAVAAEGLPAVAAEVSAGSRAAEEPAAQDGWLHLPPRTIGAAHLPDADASPIPSEQLGAACGDVMHSLRAAVDEEAAIGARVREKRDSNCSLRVELDLMRMRGALHRTRPLRRRLAPPPPRARHIRAACSQRLSSVASLLTSRPTSYVSTCARRCTSALSSRTSSRGHAEIAPRSRRDRV